MEERPKPPGLVSDWTTLRDAYEAMTCDSGHRWVYRGQRDSQWGLRSSLERALTRFHRPLEDTPFVERWLVAEFKRHAHRYNTETPHDDDIFRWLALMQHHGAPTRLLDFSYSFYVAAFFAVERAGLGDRCAIWAIDQAWCWDRAKQRLPGHLIGAIELDPTRGKTPAIQTKVLENQVCAVMPDNPFFLDERLAVQQGVFLVPLDVTKSFMHNLFGSADRHEAPGYVHKFEICVTEAFLLGALSDLKRMNISRVSLFPGLDGLAGSLGVRIATDTA
ncbi:MAG: FRG domain-containing protein [Candidatus Rokubacteria bacterium]|nr:FRG domain-containing protein [Candidatus Rokubacteria bacterium]